MLAAPRRDFGDEIYDSCRGGGTETRISGTQPSRYNLAPYMLGSSGPPQARVQVRGSYVPSSALLLTLLQLYHNIHTYILKLSFYLFIRLFFIFIIFFLSPSF